MNYTPVSNESIERLEESIAKEMEKPIEVVKLVFAEEYSAISANAKIKQFVGVIAGRRVRLRLRD
jgi:Protein of unknown function (DUF3562)